MDRTRTVLPGVAIRPINAADRDGLSAFYAALSGESRRARFHGASSGISPGSALTFCRPDHEHREGFVAVVPGPGSGAPVIVGHLCLEPAGSGVFEMAVAVADPWQGRGVGHALLDAAVRWARRHGVPTLEASMLTTNGAILGLVRSTGLPTRLTTPADGVVSATMAVTPGLSSAA